MDKIGVCVRLSYGVFPPDWLRWILLIGRVLPYRLSLAIRPSFDSGTLKKFPHNYEHESTT
jgi:hypothetical protein